MVPKRSGLLPVSPGENAPCSGSCLPGASQAPGQQSHSLGRVAMVGPGTLAGSLGCSCCPQSPCCQLRQLQYEQIISGRGWRCVMGTPMCQLAFHGDTTWTCICVVSLGQRPGCPLGLQKELELGQMERHPVL